MKVASKLLRRALEARGYYLQQRRALPYGLDYMLDIKRLCRVWNLSVSTFFDVGANWGETSAAALSRFPAATVLAFEPSADTFVKLCDHLGKHPRFSPHNIALGETCGTVPFFEYESSFYNSLVPNAPHSPSVDRNAGQTNVACMTVDAFCKQKDVEGIDVLKVDAEGCDLMVLRGARKMLSGGRTRFVYFEFNNMVAAPGVQESTLAEIGEFLSLFGFRFVATYIDRIETNPMFVVANGLFVRPPQSRPPERICRATRM